MFPDLRTLWKELRAAVIRPSRSIGASVFSAPCACGSLGAQDSTVSRRIRALEEKRAAPLVARKASGYALTWPERELKQPSSRIENEFLSFEGSVGRQSEDITRELRGTAIANMASTMRMPYFARFRAAHPRIGLSIQVINDPVQLSERDGDSELERF